MTLRCQVQALVPVLARVHVLRVTIEGNCVVVERAVGLVGSLRIVRLEGRCLWKL